jgi:cytoskeletal protein RodZ
MRMNRLQERRKRIKKLILSSILYVGLIVGACVLGISIVHYFFNPNTTVVSQDKTANQETSGSESSQDSNENETVDKTDEHEADASEEDTTNGNSEANNNDENSSNNENSNNSNVEEGLWEPIGTIQEEPHITSYDKDSVDWDEMTTAISVAIEVEKSNISLWWLGNNGGPDRSFGIVAQSGTKDYKRVEMVWVTHEGWMPTKVRPVTEEEYEKYIKPHL